MTTRPPARAPQLDNLIIIRVPRGDVMVRADRAFCPSTHSMRLARSGSAAGCVCGGAQRMSLCEYSKSPSGKE